MAKRPQSGDIDIAFDRIFTHSSDDRRLHFLMGASGGAPSPASQTQGEAEGARGGQGGRGGQRQRRPERQTGKRRQQQADRSKQASSQTQGEAEEARGGQ